jgi:beta-glucosidase
VIPQDPQIEKQIDKILSKMTLTEKVGQMTQLDVNLLLPNMQAQMMKLISLSQDDLEALIKEHGLENEYDAADLANKDKLRQNGFKFYQLQQQIQMKKGITFDTAIMDSVFVKYKVGSILNTPYTTAQSVKEWNHIIKTIQDKSLEAIGIPCLYGLDQIHGSTYISDGTLFPQGVNMAATFNRELARRTGEVTAYETRPEAFPGRSTRYSTWAANRHGPASGKATAKIPTRPRKSEGKSYSACREMIPTASAKKTSRPV